MSKKQILFTIAILFTMVMVYFSYDIMSRTTRPGAKKHLPTSISK
jgi:hypothetical protein